jgi:hypothetical protein
MNYEWIKLTVFDQAALVLRLALLERWARNSVGDCPNTRLNMRLNCVND